MANEVTPQEQTPPRGFSQQIATVWREMSPARRFMMVGLVAVTVGLMIILITQMRSATYRPLFSNLEETDAQAIMENLNGQRISYELSRDGRTILVPADEVSQLRVQLVAQGLPSGGDIGYNIFDDAPIGMTDFVQHQNYIRAIQGELTRTIRGLPMVDAARVHVSLPQDTVFLSETSKPSASVVVRLAPGENFSEPMARSILQLVARAVPDLEPEAIALIDASTGRSMTPETEDPMHALASYQERVRRTYEQQRAESIISLLEPLVGPGNVMVRVAAEFDFTESTTERTQLDRPVQMTTRRTTEISGDGGAVPGGVIGSGAELGEAEINTMTQEGVEVTQTSEVMSEAGRTRTLQDTRGGRLVRQTASIMIHHKRVETPGENEDDPPQVAYQPWSAQELADFEEIVKSAIGYQSLRGTEGMGDEISVRSMPFVAPGGLELGDGVYEKMEQRQWIMGIVRMGLLLVAVLVLFFFVLRPVTKQVLQPTFLPAEDLPRGLIGQRVGEAQEGLARGRAGRGDLAGGEARGAVEGAGGSRQLVGEIETPDVGDEGINVSIRELAEENPDEATQIVRNWLSEAS